MDYQQSLKNFHELKNFMRPWAECKIFFFFSSETEYEVDTFDIIATTEQQSKIEDYRSRSTPYAYLRHKNDDQETLYYSDDNISVEYDLFAENYNYFHCHFRVERKVLQQQFLMLVNLLKK